MAKKKTKKSFEQILKEALVKEGEQPYAVPGNWDFVRLGDVVQINPHRYKPEIDDAELCSFVPMKAVSEKLGIIENIETKPYGKIKNGYTSFKENDVLFAKITPCMENGKATIAQNLINGFGYGTTEFFVLRCSNMVSNMFLYYLVRSQSFRDSAKPNMTGTVGQRRVPKAYLDNYKLPLPPLPEQKRIVQKLSAMLDKLKEAQELIREAKETFEERRTAILNKAFTGELTKKWRNENPDVKTISTKIDEIENKPYKIPFCWKWTCLGEISELITKGSSPKWQGINYTDDSSQILFITSENVRDGFLDIDKRKYLELEFNKKQKRSILIFGDVLLNIVGASIGRAAIFNVEKVANINQAVALIRLLDKRLNQYVNMYLNSSPAKRYYSESKVDVARANLNLKDVSNIPLPLPPFEEQQEIVRILDKLLDYEDEAKELIDLEEQIGLLEKSILSKTFRGELGTNDPNDEPAIELLKRSLREKMNF